MRKVCQCTGMWHGIIGVNQPFEFFEDFEKRDVVIQRCHSMCVPCPGI